jgi:Uma2 family endonuclease
MASMKTVQPRISYEDLQQTPEDGRRYEIYDGEVFVVPAPVPLHQIVVLNLEDLFRAWVRQHGGLVLVSPIDIVLSEYNVVQPDLVFFTPERLHVVHAREPIRAAPDLAVEVLSPSTRATDRGRKMQLLARYGVPEYWLVDPDARAIEVYQLDEGAFVLRQAASSGGRVRSVRVAGIDWAADDIFKTDLQSGWRSEEGLDRRRPGGHYMSLRRRTARRELGTRRHDRLRHG